MNKNIRFAYRFHPVGQGLFATGTLQASSQNTSLFHWVFDCGSMTTKQVLAPQVSWYRDLILQSDILNLLCISHFDMDHVSGLTQLLQGKHVDTVVIPYYTPIERLMLGAMQVGRRGPEDGREYYEFLSNPVAFLLERAAGIEQIIVLHRSPPENPQWPIQNSIPPTAPIRQLHDRPLADRRPQDERPQLTDRMGWKLKFSLSDSTRGDPPFAASLRDSVGGYGNILSFVGPKCFADATLPSFDPRWEFMFFHKPENPAIVEQLVYDIDSIIGEAVEMGAAPTLAACLQAPRIRDAIKKAYRRAFPGSKRFNTAGVCAYSGPVKDRLEWVGTSSIQVWHGLPTIWPADELYWSYFDKLPMGPAILYAGDADFSPPQHRQELRNFLDRPRWEQIVVLQVPHHGSKENWEVGSSNEYHHRWSVFSADPDYKKFHHPHREVVLDLLHRHPVLVDKVAGAGWSGQCYFSGTTV